MFVFGGPGSGKTYLTSRLSNVLSIQSTSLDELYWDSESKSFSVRREESERARLLQQLVTQETWILEGVYYSWVESATNTADLIIVLSPPTWVRQMRLIKRFLARRFSKTETRKDTFSQFLSLLRYNQGFDSKNFPAALRSFAPYSNKIRKFNNADQALDWALNAHKAV